MFSILLVLPGVGIVRAGAQAPLNAPSVHGQYTSAYHDFQPLSSATQSEWVDLRTVLTRTHTVDFSLSAGASLSVCTYNVQASSDAVNWYDISGVQSCMANTMFHIESKPVRYLRVNIQTYTGTGTLSFHYTGVN
jgi:hypothetical protein